MISRVADCCFWFGRYLERAESTARLLQTSANLALDGDLTPLQVWHPVVITAGEEAEFIKRRGIDALSDGEAVQEHLSLAREVPASLARSIQAARENARSVREVVSLEVFETINELHLWMQGPLAREEFNENRYGFYRRVRIEAQLCLGLLRGTMLHDTALNFIWLGVIIERTGQTARILDVHHHAFSLAIARPEQPAQTQSQSQNSTSMASQSLVNSPFGESAHGRSQSQNGQSQSQSSMTTAAAKANAPATTASTLDEQEARQIVDVSLWLSLLRTCYGFEPFMKLQRGPVTGEAAAAFLIFEPRFPRSVRHCVQRARELLEEVRPHRAAAPGQIAAPSNALERIRVLEEMLGARAEAAGVLGAERLDNKSMHALLTEVVDQMHAVCDELAEELLGPPAAPIVATATNSPDANAPPANSQNEPLQA